MDDAEQGDERRLRKKISLNEWIAGACGALVVIGLVLETAIAFKFRTEQPFWQEWGPIFADGLVALGVAGEILFALRSRLESERLQRISDEKVVKADERAREAIRDAAETRERAAKIEQLTAWRHVPQDKRQELVDFLRNIDVLVVLSIEYQNGDPEAFSYAYEIAKLFKEAEIQVRAGANSFMRTPVFGLHIAGGREINMVSMVTALEKAGIPFGGPKAFPLMTLLPGEPKPNLQIFVAPKIPPIFDS
jgi:hypothetical protein